jgi:hypothetical protein
VLHGGPAWRANGFGPPRPAEPDRGHVEQPGEAGAKVHRVFGRVPEQQTLVKLERPAPEPETPRETREEMAQKKKQTRIRRGEEFHKEATRKVLADGKPGATARVARELGVAPSVLARWVQIHKGALSPGAKPHVSNGAKASPDEASAALVRALEAFTRAVVDARVEEAMQERMKRLL